jgi:hypothetical protein
MLRFYAEFFVQVCFRLERIRHFIDPIEGWEIIAEEFLLQVQSECERIGFQNLAYQTQRIINTVKSDDEFSGGAERKKQTVRVLVEELQRGIENKLHSCTFLRLDTARRDFYSEEDSPRFGTEIAEWVPASTYHINEAARCFALDRWDACVHHLMLATEMALRRWGRRFKLRKKTPIDLVDWKPVLDGANDELQRLRNLPKTTRRNQQIAKLAEQISDFGCIKDAYRNFSAHGREKYDETRASNLMRYVEVFMQSLVK